MTDAKRTIGNRTQAPASSWVEKGRSAVPLILEVFEIVDESNDQPNAKKRFRIEKRRLGRIKVLSQDMSYGFIAAEDFRDDVFFHISTWVGELTQDGVTKQVELTPELWVEFELDDEQFETEKRLRAKVVRPTNRPVGRKLTGRDATIQIVTHHPRARRKRPDWRDS